jgi:hypothetical protein
LSDLIASKIGTRLIIWMPMLQLCFKEITLLNYQLLKYIDSSFIMQSISTVFVDLDYTGPVKC